MRSEVAWQCDAKLCVVKRGGAQRVQYHQALTACVATAAAHALVSVRQMSRCTRVCPLLPFVVVGGGSKHRNKIKTPTHSSAFHCSDYYHVVQLLKLYSASPCRPAPSAAFCSRLSAGIALVNEESCGKILGADRDPDLGFLDPDLGIFTEIPRLYTL